MVPQPGHHRSGHGLPTGDDQTPRDIVDAVTMLTTRNSEQSVLEESVLVGEGGEMVEHRPRKLGRRTAGSVGHVRHAASMATSEISLLASCRY